MYHQPPLLAVGRRYLTSYIHVYSQINDFTQSFPLNVHNLDPYDHGFQSILLYPKVQFVLTYFHVFLRPIFYINFHVLWEGPGI